MHDDRLHEESVFSLIKSKSLRADVLPDGFKYLYFENIDSTNKYAKAHSDELEAALIVAEDQYEGVGKKSSHWWSSPYCSILATLVLTIDQEPSETLVYPLLVGAAIREALATHGIDAEVKWPNDLYIGDKKLAGILCETIIEHGRVAKLIIGFGINVNQSKDEMILYNMTSLYSYNGIKYNRCELLADILIKLFEHMKNSYEDNMIYVEREINTHLYAKGSTIFFESDKRYEGTLTGVGVDGALLLLTDSGMKEFVSGKIIM